MLSRLCRISQNLVKFSYFSRKGPLIKNVKFNTTYANVLRSHKQKKEEGGEFIKWVLLVRNLFTKLLQQ